MAEFWTYVMALMSNWAALFSLATLVPSACILIMYPRQKAWLAHYFERINPDVLLSVTRGLFVVGLFFAGFLAWRDQHQIAISKSPIALTEQIVSLRNEIAPLRAYKQQHEAREWPALTQEQQKKWISALAPYAGKLHTLDIVIGDSRSGAFTDSLRSTFQAAGLPDTGVFPGNTPDGLGVYGNRPDIVKTFADLFGQLGFPVKSHSDSPLNPQPSQVQIVIGRKVAP